MNSDIIKSLIIKNEHHRIASYVVSCLSSNIPESNTKDHGDWEQDIALYIMTHKSEILSANDASKFIFMSVWNKIKNEYRIKNTENSALEGLRGVLEMLPASPKYNDESVADSVLRLALQELKIKFPKDEAVNKLMIDYITGGENHTRDRILKMISIATFQRRKSFVTNMMKNRLSETLEKEATCLRENL